MTASLIERLRGNGEPWTFQEVIEFMEQVTMDRDVCVMILEKVRANLLTPPGKPLTLHSKQIGQTLVTPSCGCVFCDLDIDHPTPCPLVKS